MSKNDGDHSMTSSTNGKKVVEKIKGFVKSLFQTRSNNSNDTFFSGLESKNMHMHIATAPGFDHRDPSSLRTWWHNVLRDQGRYNAYAIFLVLPADAEALKYLTEYVGELKLISGQNCLVIVLSKKQFNFTSSDYNWYEIIDENADEGLCLEVARLFDIDFTNFPCVLIFKDIRSPSHFIVGLAGLSSEEISDRMRHVFSVINKAVKNKKDPILELEKQHKIEKLNETSQAIAGKVGNIAEKTYEAAMEAWMRVIIK